MIAIIKYNAGNVTSVQNAISRLGYSSIITSNKKEILEADKVIFAGVGHAKPAMEWLTSNGLDETIKQISNPFLGVCLGLQLMCTYTEEGRTYGLGIFNTSVKKFPPMQKVPHMGWNNLESANSKLLSGVSTKDDLYFVHSYYAQIQECTSATCNYILPFSATLEKNNYYAVQFHPEKSGKIGNTILKNFLEL